MRPPVSTFRIFLDRIRCELHDEHGQEHRIFGNKKSLIECCAQIPVSKSDPANQTILVGKLCSFSATLSMPVIDFLKEMISLFTGFIPTDKARSNGNRDLNLVTNISWSESSLDFRINDHVIHTGEVSSCDHHCQ